MPLTPHYNTTITWWIGLPWTGGAVKFATGLECQQMNPFVPIEPTSEGTIIGASGDYLVRWIVGPSLSTPKNWNAAFLAPSNYYFVVGTQPQANQCYKPLARTCVYSTTGLLYSNMILSLVINPASP
jgi:hypothetical protein